MERLDRELDRARKVNEIQSKLSALLEGLAAELAVPDDPQKVIRRTHDLLVARYHVTEVIGSNVAGEIVDALDALAREGARQMLEKAHMNVRDELVDWLPQER